MRMVKVEIESTKGKATVCRRGHEVVVEVDGSLAGGTKGQVWEFTAAVSNSTEYYRFASDLQLMLDGVPGTNGDIADYLRVIGYFAD